MQNVITGESGYRVGGRWITAAAVASSIISIVVVMMMMMIRSVVVVVVGQVLATFRFQSLQHIVPPTQHVPILIQNIQHGTAPQYRYEPLRVHPNGVVVERIPRFTSDRGEEFLPLVMDNGQSDIGRVVLTRFDQAGHELQCIVAHVHDAIANGEPLFEGRDENPSNQVVEDEIDFQAGDAQGIFHGLLIPLRDGFFLPRCARLQQGGEDRLLPNLVNGVNNFRIGGGFLQEALQ